MRLRAWLLVLKPVLGKVRLVFHIFLSMVNMVVQVRERRMRWRPSVNWHRSTFFTFTKIFDLI